MDFGKFLDPIWDLALKRVSKFVIPKFRDTLLVPKITKYEDLLYYEIPYFLGFQFMVILNLYVIPFHAVVVFRPEHDYLFKSASTYFDMALF